MGKKQANPIKYFYNPYLRGEELAFLEVWQVLEDEVLGLLYPWQYEAVAQGSKRIETLNFLAMEQFRTDHNKFPEVKFIYKLSAKMLDEGNVQRLGTMLCPQLTLCFGLYDLEKFGQKDSLMGLRYLIKRGAVIMLEGLERAPIELAEVYPADFYLCDYRYFAEGNEGVAQILVQLAERRGAEMVLSNVSSEAGRKGFESVGVRCFGGSAVLKPKRRAESLIYRVK